MFAFEAYAFALANFDDTAGSAGNESVGVFLHYAPCVDDVKSVDILVGVDAVECRLFIEVRGKGRLD